MISELLRLSRLKFLIGGFVGVAFGICLGAWLAGRSVITLRNFLIAQLIVTSFQLMTHYTNDYFDRESDKLTTRTDFSGGSGALSGPHFEARYALVAAAVSAGIGAVALAWLAISRNLQALELGIAVAVLAYSYSSPPLRLLARGIGELTTTFIVAILVPLFALRCETGSTLNAAASLSLVPGACAMFMMMLCVEYPDLEADTLTGKRNLVVRLGRVTARKLIGIVAVVLYGSVLAAVLQGAPATLLAFFALMAPLAIGVVRAARRAENSGFQPNAQLAASGVSLFLVTMTYSALAYAAVL